MRVPSAGTGIGVRELMFSTPGILPYVGLTHLAEFAALGRVKVAEGRYPNRCFT